MPAGPGAEFDAVNDRGAPSRFRIESVDPDPQDRDGDVYLYELSVLDAPTGVWRPYCMPDLEGRSRAIPVRGSWDATGVDRKEPWRVTFACTSGAIGKCIRFGYKPWQTVAGFSLRPYHQACVRMVRADYCGNGRSYTRDGTRIDIWDRLGIQTRDAREDQPKVFEAGWSPEGAAYVNVRRWADSVADLVNECPGRLADRTSQTGPRSPEAIAATFPDALLFNARFVRDRDRVFQGGPSTNSVPDPRGFAGRAIAARCLVANGPSIREERAGRS